MMADSVEVTFILPGGSSRTIEAQAGVSLMEAATENDVQGIVAECGGSCSCATCHVYVGQDFPQLIGPKDDFEDEMLTGTAAERRPDSRLSCQIRLDAALSGLCVTVPDTQY
jgi:2Fe-2S ferredoxin